jgi:hypothetical protein
VKLTSSDNSETESTLFAPQKTRSSISILVSIVFALAVACGLFYSYLYLRNKHAAQLPAVSKISVNNGKAVVVAETPQTQIAQDETWAKNGKAIIGGTVRNISYNKSNKLIIELEMKRRADGATENIEVEVLPKNIAPGEQGKFSLQVPSHDYSGLRILRLKDAENSTNIAFASVPGAPRPVEPAHEAKTIIVQRPAARARGEEFLNTPDNPEVIR